jgi:hypothetical protein
MKDAICSNILTSETVDFIAKNEDFAQGPAKLKTIAVFQNGGSGLMGNDI